MIVVAAAAPMAHADEALIDRGYRQMYNLEFDAAHQTFRDWEKTHPDDPMGPVSNAAAFLFAEFDRLHILQSEFFTDDEAFEERRKISPDPEVKRRFEAALENTRQLVAHRLALSPGDPDAAFAEILCHGLRADYMALIEKRYLASLSEMKTGRVLAEKLLAAHPRMYDALLAVGVENYMLGLKPAPIRWVLRMGGAQTDKEEGVRQLQLTAQHGRYLRPFAQLLLAVASLRDQDRNGARRLLASLSTEFPGNRLYKQELDRLR